MAKFFNIDDEKYEILNVSGLGNCFFDAMQIAFALHNEFYNRTEIRSRIALKMRKTNEK